MADPIRLDALASGLAPATGVIAATSDEGNNRLDWSSIEDIVRSGAGPMNINWLDPHLPPPVDWRTM
jgi:hypothetical protein